MDHKPRVHCRDPWSDLLYAKTLFHAGDFDIITDRSLEKGETRDDVTSDPLDDDRFFCLLAILILFIGRVLRRRKLVKDS